MPTEEEIQLTTPTRDRQNDETADDTIRDRLDAAERYAADAGDLRAALLAAIAAIAAAIALTWKATDAFAAQKESEAGAVEMGAQASTKPGDSAAMAEYRRRAARDLAARVAKQLAEEAATIASAAVDAMTKLRTAIASATTRAKGYGALSASTELSSMLAFERLRLEIESRGVQELVAQIDAALAVGDDVLVRTLEDAGEPFLIRTVSSMHAGTRPARGAAVTTTPSLQQVGEDRVAAMRLLTQIADRRKALVPPEVALAKEIYASLLLPSFREVLGMTTWSLPASKMARIYAGDASAMPSELEVLPGWPVRTLPDGPPPGWTPLGARGSRTPTSAGNPVAPSRLAFKGGR